METAFFARYGFERAEQCCAWQGHSSDIGGGQTER
jgi:hypothetical protein